MTDGSDRGKIPLGITNIVFVSSPKIRGISWGKILANLLAKFAFKYHVRPQNAPQEMERN